MTRTSVVLVWSEDKYKDCKLVLEDPQGQGLSSRTTTLCKTPSNAVRTCGAEIK